MKTIGFVISTKENEERRSILPKHIKSIKNKRSLYIEEGYGNTLGISDDDYRKVGANIVSREETLVQDIICDLKVGEADYLDQLSPEQTIFGWVHAEHNKELVDLLLQKKLTAIAWENMYESGRHVFWRNNEIAGEAAILHAFSLFGKLPNECHVALIGKGNVSMGAYKILSALGATIKVFDRKTMNGLTDELGDFDMVVNGILWNPAREDHIIYRKDLKKFKNPSMIVDVSCDEAGAIETSKPTSFSDPTYLVDGVIHYVVDHTPTIFSHSVSEMISVEITKYIDLLIEEKTSDNKVLSESMIIANGKILNEEIKKSVSSP